MYQHCTAQTQSQNIVNILNVHAFLNSYDQQVIEQEQEQHLLQMVFHVHLNQSSCTIMYCIINERAARVALDLIKHVVKTRS